jgi:ribosomal-protein-alanine N-acetyltransferase
MGDRSLLPDPAIEPAGPSDMKDGAKVFARAMGREQASVEEWLFDFSRRLAEAQVGHFVVARHKGTIVGYGSLVAYERLGWIGFMGTDPDLQGRGIGAAIMENLLGLARELGLKTLKLDATNIGRKLYSKFGFTDEHPARRCEIPGLCLRGTRRNNSDCVSLAEEMPDWCRSMDLRAFGDDRSPIIRAALVHGAKLLLVPGRGYGLVDGRKLGPLVATDPDAAIAILAFASTLGASVAYVPLHNELAEGFVARLTIPKEEGPITCCMRMRLGEVVEQEVSLGYADYSAATG